MRYLVVTFLRKPNGQIDEQVGYTNKIKPNDSQMANIIVDYKEKKVIKCVIEGKALDTEFERMHGYYKEIYPKLIEHLEKVNT